MTYHLLHSIHLHIDQLVREGKEIHPLEKRREELRRSKSDAHPRPPGVLTREDDKGCCVLCGDDVWISGFTDHDALFVVVGQDDLVDCLAC